MFSSALLAAVFLAGTSLALAQTTPMPKVGDKAPLVEGHDQNGKAWNLADDIGKNLILLYFYPKDETPGCTAEACSFRDDMSQLKKDGVEVIGVSFDDASSHQKFIKRYDLNFTLIADTTGKIADAYGVRMPGRDMAKRVSFLIGKDGKILHVTNSPNPEVHLNALKAVVKSLKKD